MHNFNHLYYFYMTTKSNGVTAAAERLRISQPSLSSQLKVLESALGLKLFEKIGRKNQLTRAGSMVYGYCRRMFELSEEMDEALLQKVPAATRRIYIGVSDEVDRDQREDGLSRTRIRTRRRKEKRAARTEKAIAKKIFRGPSRRK